MLLTDTLIQQIAGARLHAWIKTDDDERLSDEGLDDEKLASIEEFCSYLDAVMRSILAQGRASKNWAGVVEDVLDWCVRLGYDIATEDPKFPQLVREYATAEKMAQSLIKSCNAGEEPVIPVAALKIGICLSVMNEACEKHKSPQVAAKSVSKNLSIGTPSRAVSCSSLGPYISRECGA